MNQPHIIIPIIILFLCLVWINAIPNSDEEVGSEPSSQSLQEGSNDDDLRPDIIYERIIDTIDRPCSVEGLMMFSKAKVKLDLMLIIDRNFNEMAVRYKTKCLLTFIANLFPFWSIKEPEIALTDWTNIIKDEMARYSGKIILGRISEQSFVHEYVKLLDPKLDDNFRRRLLFTHQHESSSSSSSRQAEKSLLAQVSFENGKNGYCWPMQSKVFVTINEMIILFLAIYHGENNVNRSSFFVSSTVSQSFNLYCLCLNIQKVAPKSEVENLPESLKAIVELPISYVSSEDSDFIDGYLKTLKTTIGECSSRNLISLTATAETCGYTENIQLKQYLKLKTNKATQFIITKCLRFAMPRMRFIDRLELSDNSINVLSNSVLKVAHSTNLVDILKNGDVGKASSLLTSSDTRSLVIDAISKENDVKILVGLSKQTFDKDHISDQDLVNICSELKTAYDREHVDILSYLIHHYPKHSLIVIMLTDDESQILKYYLTYIMCQGI